ncbi:ComEC/Rec2 family competence protein [Bartonella sp. A05]|uniref:ComEC/Rec2 family competence protein n=1 Tax=Bartonella sp. A05 TaxID=2967261 RepID=UPI0022A9C43E|nr:ComEC/Rec2 family competence protein [Bartonella sp. A05]MCZ2204182.1 ComEC family competence protein [Bartonella sp. A05]
MSNYKVNVRTSIGSWLKRKNLGLMRQGNPSIIDATNNRNYNEKNISLFTPLKGTVIVFWEWLIDCIRKEISFGLLFLLILVFFATGIIFYFSLDQEPSWNQFFVTASIFFGILCAFRRYRGIRFIAGFLLCVVLGALAAKIETWHLSTSMLDSDVFTTLTGRIVSIETMEKGGFRLNVDVLKTEKPALDHGPDRVRLVAKHLPNGLVAGDGLYGKVGLRALSGSVYPGSYDFSFHNYFKGIGAQGMYLGKPVKISVPQPDTILGIASQKIENLRMKMTQRILTGIGGKAGDVSAALITGERSGISNDTNEALRKSGLAHVLSISGLHMVLLSGMVFIVIRSFFALFPVVSSYYSAKKFAAIVALIITAFYLVLSGAAIAAQRSFVMIAVMLFAILCNRSSLTMRNFAIAGLITLAIRPHEILNPGFQMSFSATAALIAAFGWWNEKRSLDIGKTTPSYVGGGVLRFAFLSVASTCASSLVAGSASGIYAAYHFSNVASLGIVSNVLALPIISIVIMPFGLMAAFAMLFGLEWLPLQIMGFSVNLVIKIAHTITAISPVLNPGFMPLSALVLLSIGLVGLTFFITPIRYFFSIFIFLGIFVCVTHSPVQLIIADNMSLVGVINEKKLYIDRFYASKFTTSIWKKSLSIDQTIKPSKSGPPLNEQFVCDDNVCKALLENGLKVAVLRGDTDQCIKSDIMIRTSAARYERCNETAPITFTPQQLLSRGSVMMTKNKKVIWSSQGFHRPWNMHKQSSQKL